MNASSVHQEKKLFKNIVETVCTLHEKDGSITSIGFYVYMTVTTVALMFPLITLL